MYISRDVLFDKIAFPYTSPTSMVSSSSTYTQPFMTLFPILHHVKIAPTLSLSSMAYENSISSTNSMNSPSTSHVATNSIPPSIPYLKVISSSSSLFPTLPPISPVISFVSSLPTHTKLLPHSSISLLESSTPLISNVHPMMTHDKFGIFKPLSLVLHIMNQLLLRTLYLTLIGTY